jgi:hypothetical protein
MHVCNEKWDNQTGREERWGEVEVLVFKILYIGFK